MATFGYAHHSSRWDRSRMSLANHVLDLVDTQGIEAVGLTEVQSDARADFLRRVLRYTEWGLARTGTGHCALAYDAGHLELLHVREHQVTQRRSWSKTGRLRAPFTALFALLRNRRTGETFLVSVAHTPSHVELGKGWRNNHRSREYRAGVRGWRRQLRAYQRAWEPSHTVVSMDANLDVAKAWVRRYLRRAFTGCGLRLVYDPRPLSTHGARTIDVVLVSRGLRAARWHRGRRVRTWRTKASDHRTILTKLRSVLRRAKGKR